MLFLSTVYSNIIYNYIITIIIMVHTLPACVLQLIPGEQNPVCQTDLLPYSPSQIRFDHLNPASYTFTVLGSCILMFVFGPNLKWPCGKPQFYEAHHMHSENIYLQIRPARSYISSRICLTASPTQCYLLLVLWGDNSYNSSIKTNDFSSCQNKWDQFSIRYICTVSTYFSWSITGRQQFLS